MLSNGKVAKMPDNKLTDNEIVKALECRVKGKCPECPYFHSYPCDKCKKLDKDALDLFNRQNAEIERLNQEIADREISHINLYNETKAEIDKLNALISETNEQRGVVIHAITRIDEVKAEAYKECVEKVKKIINDDTYVVLYKAAINYKLDNLLKELVGENDD